MSAEELITNHLDLWTGAVTSRSTAGRGRSGKIELTGIKKLRELILELAVRGKLIDRDPNDEPASVLLERIAEEKARLVKEGKIKKPKKLAEITEEEKPFELPSSWEWARLPMVYYSISPSGRNIKSSEVSDEGDFPVVDQGQSHITGYYDDESLVIRIPNPVVVFGDHTTARKYIDFDFIAGADGTKILCPAIVYPKYFYLHLLQYNLENRGYARHFKVLNEQLFAIPPRHEQIKIAKKVDELMALCDRLEQQVGDQLEAHQVLVDTLLDALTRSANATEVAENWTRIAEHFDTLFTTEASTDKLKQAILQLAVMGRLVEQDPSDEPANVLLEKIAEEKARLVKEGRIKKPKKLQPISDDNKPYQVPSNWVWTHFQNTGQTRLGKMLDKAKNKGELKDYLRNTNVQWWNFDLSEIKQLRLEEHELSEYSVESGDLLICEGGEPGRCAVWEDIGKELYIQKAIHRHRALGGANPHYLKICLTVASSNGHLSKLFTGATIKHLPGDKLARYACPLPPAAEQNRIVEKVDELITLCDELKARLSEAGETRIHLAEAVVEQAVS